MAKKQKLRGEPVARQRSAPEEGPPIAVRDLPLGVIAIAGMLLTAYLSYSAFTGEQLPYCDTGSGCDLVGASRWASLLGVPTASWGFATYAVLAFIAWFVPKPRSRWRYATLVATLGLGISLYLTAVSIWQIEAVCPYCLTSLGLITLAYLLTWRPLAQTGKRRWRVGSAAVAVVAVTLLHLHYAGVFDPMVGPEDPYLRDLAQHLKASDVVFYGAYWCPHCQEQKLAFGAAARHLPYVECTPHGRRAPRATECEAQRITSYPTWIIGGRRIERLLSIGELARLTKFRSPPAEQPADARP